MTTQVVVLICSRCWCNMANSNESLQPNFSYNIFQEYGLQGNKLIQIAQWASQCKKIKGKDINTIWKSLLSCLKEHQKSMSLKMSMHHVTLSQCGSTITVKIERKWKSGVSYVMKAESKSIRISKRLICVDKSNNFYMY